MKRNDHMPAGKRSSRISLGMVMVVGLMMFCFVGLHRAGIAEAVTYNMQQDTGTDLNGFTTNLAACANSTAPIIVPMNTTSGSNACTNGRSASTGNVGDQILLVISDATYTQDMDIAGIDVTGNLRDYQEASPGTQVGIRYQLGYVNGGTFTAFGSVDEARDHDTQTDWTTDLSAISGTAPAGSRLAIQVLKQNPNGTQYRYYFTSTSLVLNVTETPAVTCVRNAPTVSITPSVRNVQAGNSVNYTVSVTNNDSVDCTASTFSLAWTNTPGMPNANLSTTGQSASIGPINPSGGSSTLVFTHDAAAGASPGVTQDTYVDVSDANHSATTSNTIRSTVVGSAVPAGNVPLFIIVMASIAAYALFWRRRQGGIRS